MNQDMVFCGPSLTESDRASFHDISFRPPAAQGDVLRAIDERPRCIGLIDGFFGDRLAVHQKEILEAMAAGIVVLGAASMGALRAAELSEFGMVGIGKVFRGYASGALDADADVAVSHGPEALGFIATSVSMVDIRETVASLGRRRLFSPAEQGRILQQSERIHFSERTWRRVADAVHDDPSEASALCAVLTGAHVQRKRLDAVGLLRHISDACSQSEVRSCAAPMTRDYRRIRARALKL